MECRLVPQERSGGLTHHCRKVGREGEVEDDETRKEVEPGL